MPMAMVRVWHVWMVMNQRHVPMGVSVRLPRTITRAVLVLVVLIMHV